MEGYRKENAKLAKKNAAQYWNKGEDGFDLAPAQPPRDLHPIWAPPKRANTPGFDTINIYAIASGRVLKPYVAPRTDRKTRNNGLVTKMWIQKKDGLELVKKESAVKKLEELLLGEKHEVKLTEEEMAKVDDLFEDGEEEVMPEVMPAKTWELLGLTLRPKPPTAPMDRETIRATQEVTDLDKREPMNVIASIEKDDEPLGLSPYAS